MRSYPCSFWILSKSIWCNWRVVTSRQSRVKFNFWNAESVLFVCARTNYKLKLFDCSHILRTGWMAGWYTYILHSMLDRFNPITVFCSVFLFVFSCSFVCKQTHTWHTHNIWQAPADAEAHENVASRFGRTPNSLLSVCHLRSNKYCLVGLLVYSPSLPLFTQYRCDCVRSCMRSLRKFHTLKINHLNRANILMMSLGLPPVSPSSFTVPAPN